MLDEALSRIAELLGVPRSWLIMTSGGTEADNLALRGAPLGAAGGAGAPSVAPTGAGAGSAGRMR